MQLLLCHMISTLMERQEMFKRCFRMSSYRITSIDLPEINESLESHSNINYNHNNKEEPMAIGVTPTHADGKEWVFLVIWNLYIKRELGSFLDCWQLDSELSSQKLARHYWRGGKGQVTMVGLLHYWSAHTGLVVNVMGNSIPSWFSLGRLMHSSLHSQKWNNGQSVSRESTFLNAEHELALSCMGSGIHSIQSNHLVAPPVHCLFPRFQNATWSI